MTKINQMKKILIIEDEIPSANRLQKMLQSLDNQIDILAVLDSVEDAIHWFNENEAPDLAFFDIQLADGLSFSIFEKTKVNCPIVFTTAFDQYAIKAFKVNSIDYLLKPIDPEELSNAWDKYKQIQGKQIFEIENILKSFNFTDQKKRFKERFLIKKGDQFLYVQEKDIAYFYSESSLSFLVSQTGQKYVYDSKLDELVDQLDPHYFFRINRKFIIHEQSIKKISNYFNGRLKLDLSPQIKEDVIVARERSGDFKKWLDK